MDISNAFAQIEAAVQQQLVISGSDPTVEAAAEALLAGLKPAIRQVASDFAQEVATEVEAQLPDTRVEVVLTDGEPHLSLRPRESEGPVEPGVYEARLTLRLPDSLKSLVEEAAGGSGDSVNTWVVKTLSTRAKRSKRVGNRVSGTFEI